MTSQTGHTIERHPITQPIRSFISIGISIVVVVLLLVFLGVNSNPETEGGQASLALFFEPANKVINLFILSLLAIGIVLILFELLTLSRQVIWLGVLQEHAQQNDGQADVSALPPMPNQLLAPVRALFADQTNIGNLNTQSSKAVIDAISSRVEERRELVRWLIQTLILSGLIGTFWGLFGTISQIGNLVGSLQNVTAGSGGAAQGFGSLIQNLEPVLSSMGVAFSSSLLGLAGSLLLGFFELQAGGAQNRFVEELEDWLYSITKMRTAFALQSDTGDYDFNKASQQTLTLLDTVANSLDRLRSSIQSTESERAITNRNIVALSERVRDLAERHTVDQAQLAMLSQNAANFQPLMERLTEQTDAILARGAHDVELARELKVLAAGNETVPHLTHLSHEIERLRHLVMAQTEAAQQLSDRDAQNLSSSLQHLGQVIVQATEHASRQNATIVVQAIQDASQGG